MVTDTAAVLAALLAGLAAALAVSSPAQQVRRTLKPGAADAAPARLGVARWLAARPDAAPLRVRVLLAVVATFALAMVAHLVGGVAGALGWLLVPLLGPLTVIGLGLLESAPVRRRREVLVMEMPQALELLSACLAAGMPLRQATSAVASAFDGGPVAEDLARVLALVELGAPDAEAWRILRADPQWGPAVVDLARSVESGTMMVDALMHHARMARERRRSAVVIRAKAVGVRSVLPLMTCFLPSFLLVGVVPTVASAVLNALR